jgi:hypothetical protein
MRCCKKVTVRRRIGSQIAASLSLRCPVILRRLRALVEEREATATEDELVAETAVRTQTVQSLERKRTSRRLFSDHLPCVCVMIPAPEGCPASG